MQIAKTNDIGGNFYVSKEAKGRNYCKTNQKVFAPANLNPAGHRDSKNLRVKVTVVNAQSHEKTFEYYCKDWLSVIKTRIKDSTYIKYFNIVNNYILPFLGEMHPEEINDLVIMKIRKHAFWNGIKEQ